MVKLLASLLPAASLVGKSLSLCVTDRTRNMPGMAQCQLDGDLAWRQ